MAVSLADVLNELSPDDRDEVERGAQDLVIESRTLRALRKALGVTQDQLADALETTQGNVAQIESKRDVMVSTVTRIVNALGGDLHLIATFPGQANPIRVSLGGGGECGRAGRLTGRKRRRRSGAGSLEPPPARSQCGQVSR